jgi:hypothetical protein
MAAGLAGLVGGCGSSGSSSTVAPQTGTPTVTQTGTNSGSRAPAGKAPAQSKSAPPGTAATSLTTTPATSSTPSQPATALAKCIQMIGAERGLTAVQRTELDALCQSVRGGDPAKVHASAVQACVNLVNGESLPAGSKKTRALAACKTA